MSVPVRPTRVLKNLRADMSWVTGRSSPVAVWAALYFAAVDRTAVAAEVGHSLHKVDSAVH